MSNNKQEAEWLRDSGVLNQILTDIENDLAAQFRSTPDNELLGLKHRILAVDLLRGEIQSRLITYLETDDAE